MVKNAWSTDQLAAARFSQTAILYWVLCLLMPRNSGAKYPRYRRPCMAQWIFWSTDSSEFEAVYKDRGTWISSLLLIGLLSPNSSILQRSDDTRPVFYERCWRGFDRPGWTIVFERKRQASQIANQQLEIALTDRLTEMRVEISDDLPLRASTY